MLVEWIVPHCLFAVADLGMQVRVCHSDGDLHQGAFRPFILNISAADFLIW